MDAVTTHVTRRLVAGLVALLPIGGTLFTVWWMEDTVSEMWLAEQAWYFPGLGLIAVLAVIYLIGLTITSFAGRWLWKLVDRLLDDFPALGALYRTLKQVLGYGEGRDALFERAVWVPAELDGGWQLGLVTRSLPDERVAVFIPGSPNPTAGRLLLLEARQLRTAPITVNDALTTLLALGKTELVPPPAG